MTRGPEIIVERQDDQSFAVFVSGDDDVEGEFDRLFSWGIVDGRRVSEDLARRNAVAYAKRVARQLNGFVTEPE